MTRVLVTAAALLLSCALLACQSVSAASCDIDGSSRQQTIDGFGFSSAWCGRLTAAKNNALYNTLGMSILRIRIDQDGYWNEERDNTAAAHAAGAKVFGTAWTAPGKWNSNGQGNGGYLLLDHYGDFANHLKNAVNFIGVDYVSFANEPDFGGANGIYFTEPNLRMFLRNYAKSLGKPIVYPETFQFRDDWSDPALNDPETAALITFVAGHIYGGGNRVHQNALNKGKHVWQTEHYLSGANDIKTCVDEGQGISELMNFKFSAYVWWWVNDNAPNENLVKQSGEINLLGYTIGQFAKWIRPGAARIASTYQPTKGVLVTAYMSSEFVIVVVNQNTADVTQSFTIKGVPGLTSTLTIHRTDGRGNKMTNVGSVAVVNGQFTLTLPAQSISTLHGSYSGGPPPEPQPQAFTCGATSGEGESLSLSCAPGQTISSVDFASYGTPSGDCSSGFVKGTCDARNSLSVMQSQCLGKNSCTVIGNNDAFGSDPCSGTGKHLAAKISCNGTIITPTGPAPPPPSNVACASTVNENDALTLSCGNSAYVMSGVDFASYGTPTGDCSNGFVKSTCHSNTSMSVIISKCVGSKTCTVPGSNDVFGDPCPTIGKHLAVKASCAAPPPADITCATAAENDQLTLSCAGGRKISKVTFASYGTPSGTCPDLKVNSGCHAASSQSVVEAACLGKISCLLYVNNDAFTDPCATVAKKLSVAVTCA